MYNIYIETIRPATTELTTKTATTTTTTTTNIAVTAPAIAVTEAATLQY